MSGITELNNGVGMSAGRVFTDQRRWVLPRDLGGGASEGGSPR